MTLDPKQLEEWKQLSTDERLITDRSPSQVEGEEVMWKLADAVPSLIAEVEQLQVERAFAHDCGTNALREAERLHHTGDRSGPERPVRPHRHRNYYGQLGTAGGGRSRTGGAWREPPIWTSLATRPRR